MDNNKAKMRKALCSAIFPDLSNWIFVYQSGSYFLFIGLSAVLSIYCDTNKESSHILWEELVFVCIKYGHNFAKHC